MEKAITIKKSTNNEARIENEIFKICVSYYVSKKVTKKVNGFFCEDFTNKLIQIYEKSR